ncbi:hypothetical protein GGR56DRAFT_447289 [Xylariaceae sp. FL0804]|nr:hypothetical protein GGR56DRAFT_447289 [Xylariaceae sp. FL0804]
MTPNPTPTENPYQGGSPLDGGSDPSDLAGNSGHFSLKPLEIGLIVGLVVLVVASLVCLFIWRVRRTAHTAATTTTGAKEDGHTDTHHHHDTNGHVAEGQDNATPLFSSATTTAAGEGSDGSAGGLLVGRVDTDDTHMSLPKDNAHTSFADGEEDHDNNNDLYPRPVPRARRLPLVNWGQLIHPGHRIQNPAVEEHEIADRV